MKMMPPKLTVEMRDAMAKAAREYAERTGGNSLDAMYEAAFYEAPAVPANAAQALPTIVSQTVLDALRFYAHGHHYNIDDDHQQFDTVSGEPPNWLHSERDDDCTMIEDGSIARAALCGGVLGWEEPTQPVEGEALRAAPVAHAAAAPSDIRFTHPGCECCACPPGVCQSEGVLPDEGAAWDSTRHSLAVAISAFVKRPAGNRGLDAAVQMLDAITEPGSPLAWLRVPAPQGGNNA
ncbi:hypothetical protein KDW40_01940 [Burkholderia cenocepacia]|uniref:hypothetical protein n=1 Tax=Burkholderia cenocepacia TaxID=95486 RepID=UPI001B8E552B|nr:hypothetical protein [Burkholderia cenocepacia]MBR8043139.1 hypothetical protein [Burkholderia cenocepacia]MBR8324491.1 hypothetical protein [Burkholderia cenocepacia]